LRRECLTFAVLVAFVVAPAEAYSGIFVPVVSIFPHMFINAHTPRAQHTLAHSVAESSLSRVIGTTRALSGRNLMIPLPRARIATRTLTWHLCSRCSCRAVARHATRVSVCTPSPPTARCVAPPARRALLSFLSFTTFLQLGTAKDVARFG
jgi:hypothetical protein